MRKTGPRRVNGWSRVVLVFAFVGCIDCGGFARPSLATITAIVKEVAQVPTGTWGGDHIILEVTENGAEADFACARGAVEERLILDGNRRFDAKGSYVQESPGQRREEQPARSRPARYAGRVQGPMMFLTITLTDNGQTIGTFSLTKDRTPRITKCG
jgi:hypothetical protein